MICRYIIILFLFLHTFMPGQAGGVALAYDSTTQTKVVKKKLYAGPRKATIMSAILPGLGQIYNKKYWKPPIIYVGLGGFGYMFHFNNTQYKFFRKGVVAAYDNDSSTTYDIRYRPDQMQTLKLYYKKYRDLAVIGFAVIYLINIIDANVDAHLKTFDVSNDLSLNISPWCSPLKKGNSIAYATGLTFKFNFK